MSERAGRLVESRSFRYVEYRRGLEHLHGSTLLDAEGLDAQWEVMYDGEWMIHSGNFFVLTYKGFFALEIDDG